MINGKWYYHYRHCEKIMANLCMRCCFLKERDGGGRRCALPFRCEPNSYYVRPEDCHVRIANATINLDLPAPPEPDGASKEQEGEAAAEQRPTERSEVGTDEAGKEPESKEPESNIGKRSYYAFPNGVEAEDICRYLPFNLGNVVKYVCRVGRKDATKKIEDLEKAKDYLENEIKRMEEDDG